jgi:hypothetical protein
MNVFRIIVPAIVLTAVLWRSDPKTLYAIAALLVGSATGVGVVVAVAARVVVPLIIVMATIGG